MLSWATVFLTGKGFSFEQAAGAVAVGGLTSVVASIAAGLLVQQFGSRVVFAVISVSLLVTLVAFGSCSRGSTAHRTPAMSRW